MIRFVIGATVAVLLSGQASAAPPVGEAHVYKSVAGRDLTLFVSKPDDWAQSDTRPCIVFFHGGGWVGGAPGQFTEHAKHFTGRGMVCVQVEYRLLDRKGTDPPDACIHDARSAMRWVRSQAASLGIDPERIASAGGSAGGHLAAHVGMIDALDDPADDVSVSCKSRAMLLFNPVFDNGPDGWGTKRVGDRFPEISPFHNISADDPPAIIFFGTNDSLIPVETGRAFESRMQDAGVNCRLCLYEGQPHGFFNFGRADNRWYNETIAEADRFLEELEWLPKTAVCIENYEDGARVDYPVVLIRGTLLDTETSSVTASVTSPDGVVEQAEGLAHAGRFKALCELHPGENRVSIGDGTNTSTVNLTYQPNENPYAVRTVYTTDSSGATDYQTPLDDDPQNSAGKLATAMTLMQTMTAERMYDLGYGRRTFNLERGDERRVIVHTHRGELPAVEYYQLNDQAWYGQIARELRAEFPTQRMKNVVVAAYTRFDPQTRTTRGHTALGGGGQGLFGSGNLFTWPNSIVEAQRAFMDDRPIDTDCFMSDSVGRDCFWGAASTTIGATLHELGHTFGLPHTNHPQDIMTRGFDRFNRVFTIVEAPYRRREEAAEFPDDEVACFAPISAAALVSSPWFADVDPGDPQPVQVQTVYDHAQELITARCEIGVRYLGALERGDMRVFTAPDAERDAPQELQLSLAEIRREIAGNDFRIKIIAANGEHVELPFAQILEGDKPGSEHESR